MKGKVGFLFSCTNYKSEKWKCSGANPKYGVVLNVTQDK